MCGKEAGGLGPEAGAQCNGMRGCSGWASGGDKAGAERWLDGETHGRQTGQGLLLVGLWSEGKGRVQGDAGSLAWAPDGRPFAATGSTGREQV